jgi:hypothetical protein
MSKYMNAPKKKKTNRTKVKNVDKVVVKDI